MLINDYYFIDDFSDDDDVDDSDYDYDYWIL
jgi:hypothetical protein